MQKSSWKYTYQKIKGVHFKESEGKAMKKIYDKDEVNFTLIWIGIYVVLFSVAENLSTAIGIQKIVTAPVSLLLAVIMFAWIKKYHLEEKYGLCKYRGRC